MHTVGHSSGRGDTWGSGLVAEGCAWSYQVSGNGYMSGCLLHRATRRVSKTPCLLSFREWESLLPSSFMHLFQTFYMLDRLADSWGLFLTPSVCFSVSICLARRKETAGLCHPRVQSASLGFRFLIRHKKQKTKKEKKRKQKDLSLLPYF